MLQFGCGTILGFNAAVGTRIVCSQRIFGLQWERLHSMSCVVLAGVWFTRIVISMQCIATNITANALQRMLQLCCPCSSATSLSMISMHCNECNSCHTNVRLVAMVCDESDIHAMHCNECYSCAVHAVVQQAYQWYQCIATSATVAILSSHGYSCFTMRASAFDELQWSCCAILLASRHDLISVFFAHFEID